MGLIDEKKESVVSFTAAWVKNGYPVVGVDFRTWRYEGTKMIDYFQSTAEVAQREIDGITDVQSKPVSRYRGKKKICHLDHPDVQIQDVQT